MVPLYSAAMRSGICVLAAATLVLFCSCVPEVPAEAAQSPATVDVQDRPIAAAARGIAQSNEPSVGEARTAPAPSAPASLHEFLSRVDGSTARLTREDFARIFRRDARADTEPSASYEFVDLDGDGREEGYVAIGDGWWGKRHRLLAFDPDGEAWRLVFEREVATPTRGTPVVSVQPGADRPRLQVRHRSGWGTGITTGTLSVLERRGATLVEVLTVEAEREEIHRGKGPVLDMVLQPLSFAPDRTTGVSIASTLAKVSFWTGKIGDLPERIECDVPVRWRQAAAGAPFEPEAPNDVWIRLGRAADCYWHHAACAWIDRHGEAATAFAAGLDHTEASILRDVCDLAAQSGATTAQSALAERLRGLLPPPR